MKKSAATMDNARNQETHHTATDNHIDSPEGSPDQSGELGLPGASGILTIEAASGEVKQVS